jgi:chromate transporter
MTEFADLEAAPAGRAWEVARVFLKLGAISYGGPAMMGIMQAEIERKRQWISRERFVEGLALVNLLPGPLAAQLSIVLGHARAGWLGGVLGGLAFIVPGFVIMLALTVAYSRYGALPALRGVFYGLSPVVVGIFALAIYRLARTAIKDARQIGIALASALVVGLTPFGLVPTMLVAAGVGVALYASRGWGLAAAVLAVGVFGARVFVDAGPGLSGLVRLTDGGGGTPPELWRLALFFLGVGAFTYGGGLAILAFLQEHVVMQLHWLSATEFLDGLALGQLTPGPIITLAAFVGYRAAGAWGAVVSAAAIFLPSFVMVLAVLPFIERLRRVGWIAAALRGIAPAVIGMTAVALLQMAPHAATDAVTVALLALTVAALALRRLAPLPLMAAGGAVGAALRAR